MCKLKIFYIVNTFICENILNLAPKSKKKKKKSFQEKDLGGLVQSPYLLAPSLCRERRDILKRDRTTFDRL